MTAKITRLRIAGFKSFADAAHVDILPGLTGIVGPNGCGKSNVVEALRWAMGESSARALRGGELDDLIFAGTGARPARNLAEVTLWLEDATGLAPAPFAENADLEITRRAERGAGSDFRLNGKTLRARDVTTMFADLSSGARSSSIISQNRVGTLINAKPEERRALLEEAAGISGLHARRHDAELKLRQTEANMARAEDLRVQLEKRLSSLGEQTVQAKRYRSLAESLRADEVALQALLHARADLAIAQTENALAHAARALKEAVEQTNAATDQEVMGRSALAPAQSARDTARTTLERLRIQAEGAAQAEAETQRALAAAQERLKQGEDDERAAAARLADAQGTLERDIAEGDRLRAAHEALPERRTLAARDAEAAEAAWQAAQLHATQADAALLDARLRFDSRRQAAEALEKRQQTLQHDVSTLTQELVQLRAELPTQAAVDELTTAQADAERAGVQARQALETLASTRQEAELAAELAMRTLRDVERTTAENNAEQTRLADRHASLTRQAAELAAQHAEATDAIRSEADRQALADERQQAEAALENARQAENAAREAATLAETARLQASSARQDHAQRATLLQREHETALTAQNRAEAHDAQLERDYREAQSRQVPPADLEQVRQATRQADGDLTALLRDIEIQERQVETARGAQVQHDATLQDLEAEILRLSARRDGLGSPIEPDDRPRHAALIDLLEVPADLGPAVAAVLADGLDGAVDAPDAPLNWRPLPPDAFPAISVFTVAATPLSALIEAPEALRRCFDAVGVVENSHDGLRGQSALSPGQCLVSRDGALWRWDGYSIAAGRPSRAAQRLEHRRQFVALSREITERENALPRVRERLEEARKAFRSAEKTLSDRRSARGPAEQKLAVCRKTEAEVTARAAAATLALDAATQQRARAETAHGEAQERLADAKLALSALPHADDLHRADRSAQEQARTAQTQLDAAGRTRVEAARALDRARDIQGQVELQHRTAADRIATITPALARVHEDLAQIETLQDENARQRQQQDVDQARVFAEAARRKLAEETAALAAARARCQSADATLAAVSQSQRAQSEQRIALLGREAVLAPRLETQQAALSALAAAWEALPPEPDLAGCEESARLAHADATATRTAFENTRTQATLLNAEVTRLDDSLAAILPRIDAGHARLEALRRDNEEARRRRSGLQTAAEEAAIEPERMRNAAIRQKEALAAAELAARSSEDALRSVEEQLQTTTQQRESARQRAASAREDEIRLTERLAQAQAARETLLAVGPPPDTTPPADLSDRAETTLRRAIARTLRERDALGPVNLRAEQEHDEARAQADTLAHEHGELQEAINRLRGSIGHLNREGRERLQAVFAEVDRHFQLLFARMFNGGRAHLGLVGSDDPLEAGLEIFAQPPGKKLSTLSLLSGGEQALTALSLVFATFRCQPAPICVLDEVDAPLDDANVERLCALVRDMAEESGTRFVVVTHHQLTMAHMDRLFGVTMQERGVSRVLSVDLSSAAAFAQPGNRDPVS